MSKLECIIDGDINSWGGLDNNFMHRGFNFDQGEINEGYNETEYRTTENSIVHGHYNNGTGVRVDRFNSIKREY